MNLEEEVICGYKVSAQMKRIWAMELEMVKRFVEVCEEYHLHYWMMGGTLLGAVRHKGFIPWDNDIDLAMPRKDFNILLEIGPTVFKSPIFFQTPVTEDARFFCTYIKLRNENGTAASQAEFDNGINCGIFIDIFCIDEIPDSPRKRIWYFKWLNEIAKMQRFALNKAMKNGMVNRIKHFLQKIVYRYIYHSPNAAELFNIYQKEAGRYANSGCNKVAHQAFGYYENFIWDKKDWDEQIQMEFESLILNAPKGYDAILKHQYGDYMQLPEDKSTHDYFEFDPDVAYKDYFNKN